MIRRGAILACLAVALCMATAPVEGQVFRYMAFGDSITKGRLEHDPTGLGGYPGRLPLSGRLNCAVNNCEVVNEGKDGESTSAGVTRIENLLDADDWDVVLQMEGTNDIFGSVSLNTIEANLTLMDTKSRDHGVDTVHASIIHLDPASTAGGMPSKVTAVANLRTRISNLAAGRNRYYADPWTPLCPTTACFNAHYHNPAGAVGHPDPSGFDILADEFRDEIVSEPVPNLPTAIAPTGEIDVSNPNFVFNKESGLDATWYQVRVLNSVGTPVRDDWFEENAVCAGSQCTVNFGFLSDGDYTWETRGRNPRGRSAWVSTPFTIFTLVPPTAPTAMTPSGIIVDSEPDFVWGPETPRMATSYLFEVADGGGTIFQDSYLVQEACDLMTCTVDPFAGSPLADGAYTWRVRGDNAAGSSPWSELAFQVETGLIFADGFESGDTSAWDTVVP